MCATSFYREIIIIMKIVLFIYIIITLIVLNYDARRWNYICIASTILINHVNFIDYKHHALRLIN